MLICIELHNPCSTIAVLVLLVSTWCAAVDCASESSSAAVHGIDFSTSVCVAIQAAFAEDNNALYASL